MSKIILLTGGSRSGKSVIAEEKTEMLGNHDVVYLATAIPYDDDMVDRIKKHQDRRDHAWITHEGYRGLDAVIKGSDRSTFLLDDVTILITNILFETDRDFDNITNEEIDALTDECLNELSAIVTAARESDKNLVLVTNEVGMSLTPAYRLGRIFSDITGKVNQLLAFLSDEVILSVCGIPLKLK